jgi:hypothetical protein
MKVSLERMKPLLISLLALLAAVVVTLGAIQLRVWWSTHTSGTSSDSDSKKLDILASLKSSSTPPLSDQAKILRTLSVSSASTGMTESEKLHILASLQRK